MKKLILLLLLFALTSCATKADYVKEAKWLQSGITYEVVEAVELVPGIDILKAQTDNPNFVWTDEFVEEVLAFLDDSTHYYPAIRSKVKTPAGLTYTGMWGNCIDLSVYGWCVFKYLDYPYDGRIQLVRAMGLNHAMLILEMPSDKRWVRWQTANLLGMQKIDAVFSRTQIEFDTQGIWTPDNLERPDNMIDHWKYLVTEY